MKSPRFSHFPILASAVFALAAQPVFAQWTGLGAGGAATDASDPLNYTGGAANIGNFSSINASALLDLSGPTTTGSGGLNLNYAANPVTLTLGDDLGSVQTLTLAGNITFTRAALAANNSSFITGSDVTLDLNGNRSIVGTTVTGDLGTFNLTFNGAITSTAAGAQRLTVSGGIPTVTFNNNVTLDGGITFSSGTSTISTGTVLNVTGAGANALQSTGGTIAYINGQLVAGASDTIGVSGGILWLANSANSYSGVHNVSGGVLRGSDGVGIKSGNINMTGGIMETTAASFTRGLGSGDNQIRLTGTGSSGFSSRDVAGVFNIGGSGATLEWGSTFFNPGNLIVGGPNSNAVTELVNGIDIKGGSRQIYLNSTTGAIILGVISDSTGGGGITFNSTNTSSTSLTLSADNTYAGRTVIANSAGTNGATGTIVISKESNLGLTPAVTQIDNISFAANGVLRVTESFELSETRGIGIGNSGGGTVTGAINVDAAKVLTYNGIIANRTLNVGGSAVTNPNTGSFRKLGTGALNLFGTANSYTGATFLSAGTLRITKISNGGIASSIGAGSTAAADLILGNGRLEYIGAGDTTDRLFSYSTSTAIDSSGSGALRFTNTGAIVGSGTASARTITLTGYNKDANTIASGIGDSGTGTNITNLIKSGSGNWTLAGTNTFTGIARSYGGTLTFDYSGAGNTADPLSATSQVRVSGGGITFKGRTSGTTTESLGSLVLDSPTGSGGLNVLTVDSNGGAGVALTVGTLNSTTSPQAATLIDLSSNAGNSITVNALGANVASTGTGNVLMVNQNRANIIVRDATGYGFATLSTSSAANATGLTSTIGKLTGGTALDSSNASVTTNYTLNTSVSRTAALNFQTLTIDASAADITVALGANNIGGTTGGNGRGILISGDKNVDFTGTGTFGTSGMNSVFLHHYGTGIVSLSQGTISGTSVLSGTGRIHFGGNIHTDNNFLIQGTTVRVTGGTDLATSRNAILAISSGGVLEIGSDLNGANAGDFSNTLGGAAGNVRFFGDSGLSASGADRVVNFGGAGATLNWGSTSFLTNNDGTTDGDYTFKLSSAGANAKVTIENGINLNNRNRVIDVANGSASIDAALTGAISGDGVGFTKLGAGTLELTGANIYNGATKVLGGQLDVGGSGINSSTQVFVKDSTLNLTAGNVLNNTADITLENARLITNGNAETTGALAIVGNNQLDLVSVGNVIRFADSSDVVWNSTLAILDWTGLSTGGGSDQVFFGTDATGLTASQLGKITFVNPTIDGNAQTGIYSANILASGEIVAGALIPEPSTVMLGSLGAIGFALCRRRKSA